eukprot:357305-Chlamydomonas_euryale.AAC.7
MSPARTTCGLAATAAVWRRRCGNGVVQPGRGSRTQPGVAIDLVSSDDNCDGRNDDSAAATEAGTVAFHVTVHNCIAGHSYMPPTADRAHTHTQSDAVFPSKANAPAVRGAPCGMHARCHHCHLDAMWCAPTAVRHPCTRAVLGAIPPIGTNVYFRCWSVAAVWSMRLRCFPFVERRGWRSGRRNSSFLRPLAYIIMIESMNTTTKIKEARRRHASKLMPPLHTRTHTQVVSLVHGSTEVCMAQLRCAWLNLRNAKVCPTKSVPRR